MFFLAEEEAVVRIEDDDGVLRVRACVESVQQTADLFIGEADAGEIGMDGFAPVVGFDKPIVIRGVAGNDQFPDDRRKIVAIIFPD